MTETLTSGFYLSGILSNKRNILSKAITLIESNKPDHNKLAAEIIEKCYSHSGNSVRIGITGPPGAGKSTFIEALGTLLVSKGKKVAVLAIDPSSTKSSGSILGDKTRMEKLSCSENAFVRPSPSSGELGGTGTATREAIILCEAAGYEIIFVETVGVGQSETDVHSMVDLFLLLTIAGAGDELQGIKRGIMEMADIVVINKEDNIKPESQIAHLKSQISNALHLFHPSGNGWAPEVLSCSSLTGKGIEAIWETASEYFRLVKKNGFFELRRNEQLKYWFRQTLERELKNKFYNDNKVKTRLKKTEKDVLAGKTNPVNAAREIIKNYESGFEKK